MSAPIKPKTKGRKSKIPDVAPSNVQAQAISKPQLPPTAASQGPQTAMIAKGNSMSVPVSAGPRHGVGGSLAEEQMSPLPRPEAALVLQRTGTPRPQPKAKAWTPQQQQQVIPKEAAKKQQKLSSTPQQQSVKDPQQMKQQRPIPQEPHQEASPRATPAPQKVAGLSQGVEITRLKAALKEEQGKSQSMGMVVKYLENAKEALEKEKQTLLMEKSTEVHQVQQGASLQVKELSAKLADAESKKAAVEATLALRERQASEEKRGEVKKLEDSIRNVRTSAQYAVEEKEVVIKELQQKLKTAEHNLEQKKYTSLEADKVKIKDLEEQCIRLQESKKEAMNKFNTKNYEAKLKSKDEEVAALQSKVKEATSKKEFDVKALEGRLELAQAQVNSLMSTMTTKDAAWRTKEDGLVKKQEDKMKLAQEKISTLQTALQTKDEEKGKRKNYEERIKKLEENLRTTKEKSDKFRSDMEVKLRDFNGQVKQEKAKSEKLEKSVKELEESNTKLEKKAAAVEAEKQKLKEEKVTKAKAAKKEQTDLKAAVEAKATTEKQLKASELRVKELETQVAAATVESEETKLKLGEVELDCGEAVAKYKDLQERKSEADMKYLEAEREVGEVRKACEEHREKFEHAVSNKTRYEYQINFLEEKVRRLTKTQGSLPEMTAPVIPPAVLAPAPPVSGSTQDVNEQFLSLLDTDTAAKFKELEEKCESMKEQQSKLEEKLKNEAEKNLTLARDAEQVEAKLVKMQELEKENVLLQEKLDVAAKEDMNLFVLEDVPVILSGGEGLEGVDGKNDVEKDGSPEEVAQEDAIEEADAMKAEELVKAAEEKMLEAKDKAAEEENTLLKEKDTELKQLRGALAELTSNSTDKESKLLEEIETLKSKLGAKYLFLECGVKVKKVSVEDTDKVVNVGVQDLVASVVDQEASTKDVTNDFKEEEEDKISKDEVKENILLRAENERIKSEMATMAKAMGSSKEMDQGGRDHEKAEIEAKEMKWKGVLAEAALKVESLSKEKEEREKKIQEQTEELKRVLENEVELKQTITIVSRVKESAQQEKEKLKRELEDLKEKSQPKIDAEMADSMELLKAELDGLKKEKSLQAYHVADELLTLEKELGLKRKRSVSGGEVKKSKLERVEEEGETRETSEVSKDILAVSGDPPVAKELCRSEKSTDTQNIPLVTQLEKEKAELEQELRMKEKSGKEVVSEDVRVTAISEEALLASPQPAAKPANILFCNWAVPEEEVESEVKNFGEVDGSSFDNPLSTLEDSVN